MCCRRTSENSSTGNIQVLQYWKHKQRETHKHNIYPKKNLPHDVIKYSRWNISNVSRSFFLWHDQISEKMRLYLFPGLLALLKALIHQGTGNAVLVNTWLTLHGPTCKAYYGRFCVHQNNDRGYAHATKMARGDAAPAGSGRGMSILMCGTETQQVAVTQTYSQMWPRDKDVFRAQGIGSCSIIKFYFQSCFYQQLCPSSPKGLLIPVLIYK